MNAAGEWQDTLESRPKDSVKEYSDVLAENRRQQSVNDLRYQVRIEE